MPEVSAVVFDVGRVIVQWDMRRLLARVIADPAELEFVFANVVSEQWHFRHDAGEELETLVAERKAEFPQHAAAIDAYATRFNETIPGLVPGTPALIDRLADRGIPLYAITNFAAPFWDAYRPTEPLFRHFRDVVVSGVEKIAKPDPAIYRLAERRFGHPADSMLFIDDNPANIDAARALGWQAHLFGDAQELEADLTARGLI
ncbi:MAG: HAD family phosphatase [Novosphingobium sp.]|nr:HAD family phosphatase [Novosphingobium sp.]MBO9603547.1 HAD family phosphatase [Novosphingobium sp.]